MQFFTCSAFFANQYAQAEKLPKFCCALVEEWQGFPEVKKQWVCLKSEALFPVVLILLCRSQSFARIYEEVRKYTAYLSQIEKWGHSLYLSFISVIGGFSVNYLKAEGLSILLNEALPTIRSNNFLSTFIFLFCLRVEKAISQKDVRRLLILSMANADRFPEKDRHQVRKGLVNRLRMVKDASSRRKHRIMLRRECYAKGDITELKKMVKQLPKWPKSVVRKMNRVNANLGAKL